MGKKFFQRGGKFKSGDKWTKKKINNEEGQDDRQEYDDAVHGGSFTLDEIKAHLDYQRRVDQGSSPKKKYALAVGYCGTNYHGLQINPGAITVESILERSLFLCGGIQECNFGHLQKVAWTRAARTDKGVHAVGQCCSMKLLVPPNRESQFLEELNSFLPSDIRVMGMTRVTKSFNARSHCSHRRYEYLLPTYMLRAASEVKDIFRKQPNPSTLDVRSVLISYRSADSPSTLDAFRANMSRYLGTHNYHNFTNTSGTGKAPSDASMQRYMMGVTVSPPFLARAQGEVEEVEWVKISITGQSFLFNQVKLFR
jgi:tRNA pseudouridine38-40 synthase